jgi:hypothetical protein
MNKRHKHADVIIAWANGEEIEYKWHGEWHDWDDNSTPSFYEECEYRIKPKRVKKEGWVNLYPDKYVRYTITFHSTEQHADVRATEARIACIRIEWEEEA